jgi:uncharacterized protein (TIGR04255 family)
MPSNNTYNKNFLTNVFVRLDYPNPLPIQDSLSPKLTGTLLKSFPIYEPGTIRGSLFKFDKEKGASIERDSLDKQWTFFNADRSKNVLVCKNFLLMTYTKYNSYESFKKDFIDILTVMHEDYGENLIVSRMGLRYVNEINIEEADPLDWNRYINGNLLCFFNFSSDRDSISRGLGSLIWNYGDMYLVFNFGMHNPDFPSTIRKKSFILDYDAVRADIQNFDEIVDNMDRFHAKIEELFKLSIKEPLEEIMYGRE